MKQYLICLKSESFSGVFKIVLTAEDPNELRNRMNADGVAPFPMVIDFAKEIEASSDTLTAMEAMLASAGHRYGTDGGWWKIQWNFIAAVFAFHAGTWCTIYPQIASIASLEVAAEIKTQSVSQSVQSLAAPEYKSDDESGEDDTSDQHDSHELKPKTFRRNMRLYFTHGQQIRHSRGSINTPWVGSYNALSNAIIHAGVSYSTMSAFATAHYGNSSRDRKGSGWVECEYGDSRDGWKPTKNMAARIQ